MINKINKLKEELSEYNNDIYKKMLLMISEETIIKKHVKEIEKTLADDENGEVKYLVNNDGNCVVNIRVSGRNKPYYKNFFISKI